jgi:hypothetical protein
MVVFIDATHGEFGVEPISTVLQMMWARRSDG